MYKHVYEHVYVYVYVYLYVYLYVYVCVYVCVYVYVYVCVYVSCMRCIAFHFTAGSPGARTEMLSSCRALPVTTPVTMVCSTIVSPVVSASSTTPRLLRCTRWRRTHT